MSKRRTHSPEFKAYMPGHVRQRAEYAPLIKGFNHPFDVLRLDR